MATARKASRRTLIYLLRLAASSPKGLPRKQIIKNNLLAKELNRVQASHWEDKGFIRLASRRNSAYEGAFRQSIFHNQCGA